MKLSQAKDYLPFVQAAAEGKLVQWQKGDKSWEDFSFEERLELYSPECLRIKPTPSYRAWKAEEVPVGALIRTLKQPNVIRVILGVHIIDRPDSITHGWTRVILDESLPSNSFYTGDLFTYHGGHNGDRNEYSVDKGVTWLPCGVAI